MYQSLANLIRWADQVMLDGIDLEDKENVASVTSVIKAVLDGVKVCLPLMEDANCILLYREGRDSLTLNKTLNCAHKDSVRYSTKCRSRVLEVLGIINI